MPRRLPCPSAPESPAPRPEPAASPFDGSERVNGHLAFRLLVVFLALVLAQAVGTVFNIWYNVLHILPLLTEAQKDIFFRAVNLFNGTVYPAGAVVLFGIMRSLYRAWKSGDPDRLRRARQRAINLPWWALGVAALGWLLGIFALLGAVHSAPGPLDPRVNFHLPVSMTISGMIAVTHGIFAVELLSQRLIYPFFFSRETRPARTPGALPVTLRARGMLWAVSAVFCPIVSLLLLMLAPDSNTQTGPWFPLSVGGISVAFAAVSGWLLGHLVGHPVSVLQNSAEKIASGNLDAEIDLLRADEFGMLVDEFNHMLDGLREKQRIERTVGGHLGREVARRVLRQGEDLGGVEREISVLFADIRGFTQRCADCTPRQAVSLLNFYHASMVEAIEAHGGMVNQIIGDGTMAIFETPGDGAAGTHADRAIAAGKAMIRALDTVNQHLADRGYQPISIGVGINTGPVVIGSIGSPHKKEYTAIGDTVNVGSRIESLTKEVGKPLLFSRSAYQAFSGKESAVALPPQSVKGKAEPIEIFTLGDFR